MLNQLHFSTCNIRLSVTEEESGLPQGMCLQGLARCRLPIFCIFLHAFSFSHSPMLHSGVRAPSVGCKKGFKAVLGIFRMKGKGCFSHPQEANRKIGCQFKGREGPPWKPRAQKGAQETPLLLTHSVAGEQSEESWRLMPLGLEDCGLLQALQMRYQGSWVPNCPVCSCRQALQLCDHTRLQLFLFQTKTPGLDLARTRVTTCSFTDLGQGRMWYCMVSSVSG